MASFNITFNIKTGASRTIKAVDYRRYTIDEWINLAIPPNAYNRVRTTTPYSDKVPTYTVQMIEYQERTGFGHIPDRRLYYELLESGDYYTNPLEGDDLYAPLIFNKFTENMVLWRLRNTKRDNQTYFSFVDYENYQGSYGQYVRFNILIGDENRIAVVLFKDTIALASWKAGRDEQPRLITIDPSESSFDGIGFARYGYPDYSLWTDDPSTVAQLGVSNNKGGYNGTFDNSSDKILLPNKPTIGIANNNLLNLYKLGSGGILNNIINEVFPQPSDADDIVSALTNIYKTFQNQNLVSFIKKCHIIPCNALTSGLEPIKVGYRTLSSSASKVTSDYVDVTVGSVSLKEYYGSFIDYIGTSCQLFLPFFGYVDIEPELVLNGTISVTYRFNVIDGSFMIFVKSTSGHSNLTDSVIAQYSGNCVVNIPIVGVEGSTAIQGLVNGAVNTLGGATSGNLASAMSGITEIISAKPTVNGSNSYGASASFLGLRTCFIKISRAVSNTPNELAKIKGLESNLYAIVKDCSGFVKYSSVEYDQPSNIPQNELDMIEALLLNGIYK